MGEDGPRKPFAAFVQEQRNGGLHAELSEALGELVQAVAQHGKSGTLQLTVKVAANGDDTTVTVTDRVVVKVPEGKRAAALFFFDHDGNLLRRNPAQQELPLKEVERPAEPDADAEATA